MADGVSLLSIAWTGTPAHAAVTLGRGEEKVELSADASLVSKSVHLPKKPTQIEIESKFFEIPDAMAAGLKLPNGQPFVKRAAPPTPTATPSLALQAVLNPLETEQFVRDLNAMNPPAQPPSRDSSSRLPLTNLEVDKLLFGGASNVLAAPRVTTKAGQRAVIEIIRELRYASAWNRPDEKNATWTPKEFETRNVGVTLEVSGSFLESDSIHLQLRPQVVEFLGYADLETGKPLWTAKVGPEKSTEQQTTEAANFDSKGRPTRAVFSAQEATVDVNLRDGQTLVLVGLAESEKTEPFHSSWVGRQLVVLVTAVAVDQQGKPRPAAPLPGAAASQVGNQPPNRAPEQKPGLPFALAVPNKPGFVRSPYAPEAGYVDVRGFPPGTDIQCPYTSQLFRLP
jgi:type II/III secretion system protein